MKPWFTEKGQWIKVIGLCLALAAAAYIAYIGNRILDYLSQIVWLLTFKTNR